MFVITTGIVVGLGILYFIFTRQPSSGANTSNVEISIVVSDPMEEILGRQIIASLNKVKDVKLDVKFLEGPVFQALQDFTVAIPAQNIGRRDPFANIGTRGASQSNASDLSGDRLSR
jgi:hypothetical protein